MFCTSCGANVLANSNFCGHCGAKIAAPVAAHSADTSNIEAPARTKPETVQSADTSNIEAPVQAKVETAQSAITSDTETAARPKSETAWSAVTSNAEAPAKTKWRTEQSAEATVYYKLLGLGVFWTVACVVGSFLPIRLMSPFEYIIQVVVLAGLGSILLSLFLGGDAFDHLGSGLLLALAGLVLGYLVIGWGVVEDPASALIIYCNYPSRVSCSPLPIVLGIMALNLCKVAVGMVIVAIPTLPIILKLKRSRG
jgi:zinc-ribbon domain